ncbi:hypothetical protein TI39_contig293g00012 [Zymoseptoria brevis]|uniref:Uncharacterized protein n=1 Tax=Zymoseptoria brevis TaxID=1047168 RepID=A0A0F4GVW1_9PEZI|nr:hypothetical protein TI39_contig293g00012 [Zymoseptoria brevis]
MAENDLSWVDNELGDLLKNKTQLDTAIYVADDPSAKFHVPENKGNEAMVWLTWMIDMYDNLPEVTIFMHGHPAAWHNNFILEMSSSQMVRHLNLEKVKRDGYVSLRCHWHPGCPTHIHLNETVEDPNKPEEVQVREAWKELWPSEPIPEVLSTPCCSQFAVSRDQIRVTPRERYIEIRTWLRESEHPSFIVGRIFEYIWHVIMNNGSLIFCPDPRICYCEVYDVCMSPDEYTEYFEIGEAWRSVTHELRLWKEWYEESGNVDEQPGEYADQVAKESGLDPEATDGWTRGDWLQYKANELYNELNERRQKAFDAAKNPATRTAVIEAALQNPLDVPASEDDYPWWF